mmetsp:Transcript_29939/g.92369  ORF Transcript_29939/g.92369 Transcript_29939/m.92369 type:complete len:163 (-) Transcript_29939:233-721(-)
MSERPVYSRGLMGSRSKSAQRPVWGKATCAVPSETMSPTRADAGRAVPPVPMPPPSAVPSVRPVARQRPLAMALDLFDARGTPAVALRAHRLTSRDGCRPSRSRAAAMGVADDTDEFSPAAAGPADTPHIPITVEDGWGDLAAAMPPLEPRGPGTSHGRRRR